jgi:hypothetical protein
MLSMYCASVAGVSGMRLSVLRPILTATGPILGPPTGGQPWPLQLRHDVVGRNSFAYGGQHPMAQLAGTWPQ